MTSKTISINQLQIANDKPFTLFGGMNVLESKDLAFTVAEHFCNVTETLGIPYVFKASFDKANRSSITSFRGPGLEKGLSILSDIKKQFNVPILTDVHESSQAIPAAEVADILQIPAFLCRQTDLVEAIAKTNAVINIKKAQFLAPNDMRHIIKKCEDFGNHKIILCERGTSFGYHNLVVDMLSFPLMKEYQYPVIFDVTHALQLPGGMETSTGGRRHLVTELARSAMAQGIAGLFLETHPDPDKAKCDGPCALRLDQLTPFLEQIKALDSLVKTFSPLKTD